MVLEYIFATLCSALVLFSIAGAGLLYCYRDVRIALFILALIGATAASTYVVWDVLAVQRNANHFARASDRYHEGFDRDIGKMYSAMEKRLEERIASPSTCDIREDAIEIFQRRKTPEKYLAFIQGGHHKVMAAYCEATRARYVDYLHMQSSEMRMTILKFLGNRSDQRYVEILNF